MEFPPVEGYDLRIYRRIGVVPILYAHCPTFPLGTTIHPACKYVVHRPFYVLLPYVATYPSTVGTGRTLLCTLHRLRD